MIAGSRSVWKRFERKLAALLILPIGNPFNRGAD